MRFTTEHAHAILAGAKTQHRVPMQRTCRLASNARGQVRVADRNGELTGIYREQPYRPGDEHAIQRPRHVDEMTALQRVRYEEGNGKRGHVGIGRFAITSVHAEFLAEITFDSARAEGHRSRADFARTWMGFPADDTSSDDDVLEVFTAAHADTPVWVLGLIPVARDTPRLLGIKAYDHTEDGRRIPEPEKIDEWSQDRITRNAGRTLAHYRTLEATNAELEAALLSIDERVRRARTHAYRLGIDVSREVWMVESLRAKDRPARMIEARVVVLERKVHTEPMRRSAA